MKNLKRVVVITIAIICGIVSMSGCQKNENESKEMTWVKSSEVVDNTDEHLQNIAQHRWRKSRGVRVQNHEQGLIRQHPGA